MGSVEAMLMALVRMGEFVGRVGGYGKLADEGVMCDPDRDSYGLGTTYKGLGGSRVSASQRVSPSLSTSLIFSSILIMWSFALASGFLAAVVAASSSESSLEPRQNSINATQNWANDYADVDFNNNAGGNFNVTWDNNPGGNFVVGKGYRPGRDM